MDCPAGSPANIAVDQNGFFIEVKTGPATKGPSNAYCNCLVGIIAIAMGVIYLL